MNHAHALALLFVASLSLAAGVAGDSAALTAFLQSLANAPPSSTVISVTPLSVSDYSVQWPSSPAGPYNVTLMLINGAIKSTVLQAANSITFSNLPADTTYSVSVKASSVALTASFSTPKLTPVSKSGVWSDTSLWPNGIVPCASNAVVLTASSTPSDPPTTIQITESVALRGVQFLQPGSGFTFAPGSGIYLLTESQASAASNFDGLPSCSLPVLITGGSGSSSGGGLPIIPIAAGAGGGILIIVILVVVLVRRRRRVRLDDANAAKNKAVAPISSSEGSNPWNDSVYTVDGGRRDKAWTADYGGDGHIVSNYGFATGTSDGSKGNYATIESSSDENVYSVVGEDGAPVVMRQRGNTLSSAAAYHSPPEAIYSSGDSAYAPVGPAAEGVNYDNVNSSGGNKYDYAAAHGSVDPHYAETPASRAYATAADGTRYDVATAGKGSNYGFVTAVDGGAPVLGRDGRRATKRLPEPEEDDNDDIRFVGHDPNDYELASPSHRSGRAQRVDPSSHIDESAM